MDASTINLIISLISGLVGGNIAGAATPDKNLGGVANSVLGLLGGGVGDFLLRALGVIGTTAATTAVTGQPATGHEFDIGSLLANIGVSGVSGGVLTAIIAFVKDAMAKK